MIAESTGKLGRGLVPIDNETLASPEAYGKDRLFAYLHADDRAIRTEERADARVNGGHITKGEQRVINQQENANSRAIYDERH